MTDERPEENLTGQSSEKETPFHMEPQVFQTLLEVFISLGVFLVIGEILTGVLVGTLLWKDVAAPLHLKVTSMAGYGLGIFLAGAGFLHMAKKAGEKYPLATFITTQLKPQSRQIKISARYIARLLCSYLTYPSQVYPSQKQKNSPFLRIWQTSIDKTEAAASASGRWLLLFFLAVRGQANQYSSNIR
jgi:hypothetical protein